MYATLSYDVSTGSTPVEEVRQAILDAFRDREICDLLADTFICEVKNTADYLAIAKDLKQLGGDLDGQFQFVFTLHSAGAPLRSNSPFPKAAAARIIGVLVFLLLSWPAAAQDLPFIAPSGTRPMIRPDGTYVFQHLPNSDLVFEGQIAPRIIIVDSIGNATTRVLLEGKPPAWGYQVSTTPMVRLRMFNETSNPVRTPSYMPKGTFQLARFQNTSPATDTDTSDFNAGPVSMWLLDTIPFGHHSNGQNGCLFMSQVRGPDNECVAVMPSSAGDVNRENGSFSTNYIEAVAFYGRMYLDSEDAPAGEFATRWEWRVGAGFQLNPTGYAGGAIDDELADLYGRTRILVSAMTARRRSWRCGRIAADLDLQYLTDAPSAIPSVITQLEGACFPSTWGGAGVFVRVHHGQDYYNLGFPQSITRLQFGITLQRDQFLSFRISPL